MQCLKCAPTAGLELMPSRLVALGWFTANRSAATTTEPNKHTSSQEAPCFFANCRPYCQNLESLGAAVRSSPQAVAHHITSVLPPARCPPTHPPTQLPQHCVYPGGWQDSG